MAVDLDTYRRYLSALLELDPPDDVRQRIESLLASLDGWRDTAGVGDQVAVSVARGKPDEQ